MPFRRKRRNSGQKITPALGARIRLYAGLTDAMFQRRFNGRTFLIGMCLAAVALCATPASAGKRAICTPPFVAYKKALESEKAGRVGEARELLQTCLQATVCGGLWPKCTAKYNELAGAETTAATATAPARTSPASPAPASAILTPDGVDACSVVPVVTDDAGEPRVDVQVRVDGKPLVSHLDGKGVRVEPGVHEFTFSADDGVFSTQKIMIVEGQRNRVISASVHSSDKGIRKTAVAASAPPASQTTSDKAASDRPAPRDKPASDSATSDASSPRETAQETTSAEASQENPPRKQGRSPFVYLLGGAGLAGIGTGVVLTAWGIKNNGALSQCSPNCPQSRLDYIRSLYLASDISAGVGLAALGIATWLFVRSGSGDEKPPNQQALQLDVHPTPAGAFASVSRAF
jgi:hypothetical protein